MLLLLFQQLRLDYGGGDVTQVFYWLLKKSGFPHSVNLSKKLDAMLLNKLKHEFCHVNLVSISRTGNKLYSHHHPCLYYIERSESKELNFLLKQNGLRMRCTACLPAWKQWHGSKIHLAQRMVYFIHPLTTVLRINVMSATCFSFYSFTHIFLSFLLNRIQAKG